MTKMAPKQQIQETTKPASTAVSPLTSEDEVFINGQFVSVQSYLTTVPKAAAATGGGRKAVARKAIQALFELQKAGKMPLEGFDRDTVAAALKTASEAQGLKSVVSANFLLRNGWLGRVAVPGYYTRLHLVRKGIEFASINASGAASMPESSEAPVVQ